jgi:tetratricopeptide (TPR) repeat protein
MTRGREEHLSSDDLKCLLAPEALDVPSSLRDHLKTCSACRERLYSRASEGDNLKLLGIRSRGRGPDCYSPRDWTELAAGIVSAENAQPMLHHAAQCDACGQELKSALADLHDDAGDDVSQITSGLSDPDFPSRMAETLTQRGEKSRMRTMAPRPALRRLWSAAAALAIAIASIGYWLMRDRDPGVMLAQAAAEHRRLPIRISDAPYAPSGAQRSGDNGAPAVLAEAEAAILRKLERDPENLLWLRYRSRVELLRGRYRPAVSVLGAAADDPRSRSSVLVDLGTAWLAQGLTSQRPDELQQALGYLSEALEREPANPVARFNRAIAAERLSLLDSAETDWNLFLAQDSGSGWAAEARTSLERVRQKKTAGAKQ